LAVELASPKKVFWVTTVHGAALSDNSTVAALVKVLLVITSPPRANV